MNDRDAGKYLGIRDAAERLALHPETLRRWGKKGTITEHRTPGGQRRYRESDIDEILKEVQRTNEH